MNTNNKHKILIVGDAYIPTGYSRVIRSIFEPLVLKYNFCQMAVRYNGEPHDYPWQLLKANENGDPYGFNKIGSVVADFDPDIIFILYDVNFQGRYIEEIRKLNTKVKIVCYSPVESGPLSSELLERVNMLSYYVVFTEFAKKEVLKTIKKIREQNPLFHFPEISVIPHGIDTDVFYPLPDIKTEANTLTSGKIFARQQLGLTEEIENNAFIVLNANRNMPKKRMDLTIEGFAKFSKNKPKNVKLYLHTAMQYTGWNIAVLAKRFDIEDRLILTTDENKHPEVTSAYLNLIYNACDVGINTSTNEGWGLVSFEHAATMKPQLVPNHTCLSDLWKDSAQLLNPFTTMINTGDHCEGFYISADEVANGLEKVYSNTPYREELTKSGYKTATKTEYHWKTISKSWDAIFKKLLDS